MDLTNYLAYQLLCPHPVHKRRRRALPDGGDYVLCEQCNKVIEARNALQRRGLD